jgi:hypothetical protein
MAARYPCGPRRQAQPIGPRYQGGGPGRPLALARRNRHAAWVTSLDLELTTLRRRSHRAATYARLRRLRPFERRAIREPADRDAYWATVQQRLAAIGDEARTLYANGPPPPIPEIDVTFA